MDPMDFKPEHLWLHGKAIHFKDQDFRYSVNTSKWWIGILLLGAMILFQIFSTFGFFFSVPDFSRHPAIWAIFSFPAILIILFTLGFCLAIHNYRATRGKILIMSRGKDTFLYGLTDDLKEYKKSDILEMIFYGGQSRRYGMLCYTRLIFKSGIEPDLYFPNSLIKDTDLISKLPEIPHRYTVKFLPPIPSS
jgi:hypothetical protein